MDFSFSTEEQAFRGEIRKWLASNVPGDWGSPAWPHPKTRKEYETVCRDWHRKMYDAGWVGVDWPKQYGGREASPIDSFVFQEEMGNYITPPSMSTIGIGMAGPTIMTHGTEEQKSAHLEKILSGEEIWCQGFSEPNAGSDLAGLKTFAMADGDDFVINGQKIWTSVAHVADWCILITRTDQNAEGRHRGMSYFIVDMHSPGIEVRPLRQITGDAEFNEVFFKDVRVPKENILGGEDNGWMVAITTLMHERVNIAAYLYGRVKKALNDVVRLTQTIERNGEPLCNDPLIRQKLVHFHIEVETQRLNNLRMRANMKVSDDPGPIGSIFKILFADTNKNLLEMAVDILGPYAELLPESDGYGDDIGTWMKSFLRARANSIEGGTTEILLNIVGERVLGLPR